MNLWGNIAACIGAATGAPFAISERHGAGGGCINQAFVASGGGRRFFIKTNGAERLAMFQAEAEGLAELARSGTIRVPAPVVCGAAEGSAFLVLEFLELGGRSAGERFGRALAAMHATKGARFGWHRDNTIGSTPQRNGWADEWVEFLRDRRIGFQLTLAGERGMGRRLREKGEELIDRLPYFFRDYRPAPSLLHGDLWGGNAAVLRTGEPVIFDPAVYYGDRETDLAMTELFGGFDESFRAAYREAWPLDPGYASRKSLYNLYHVLNHFNLFGGGYSAQAEGMIDRLLAEMR